MSISPKLSNSTPEGPFQAQHERLRVQPDVLRALIRNYEYQLKFVIAAAEDVAEASAFIAMIGADPGRVLLMPEGTDSATLHERSLWLAEECKRRAYRFSPRLHVELWGLRRGV
jgi:7-carboxy-7-deazaguanine synthase